MHNLSWTYFLWALSSAIPPAHKFRSVSCRAALETSAPRRLGHGAWEVEFPSLGKVGDKRTAVWQHWGRMLEGWSNKAARLAGWGRVTRQVWFCTWCTGLTACLFRTVPVALTGAAQLRACGISSSCCIVKVHNHPTWAMSRKEGMAWYWVLCVWQYNVHIYKSALRTHLSQAMRTVRKMEQQKLMLFNGYANLNSQRRYINEKTFTNICVFKVSCIKDSKGPIVFLWSRQALLNVLSS